MFESYAIIQNISSRGRQSYMAHYHDNTLREGDIVLFKSLIKDALTGDEEVALYGKVTAVLSYYTVTEGNIPEFMFAWFGESIVEIEEVYSK